MADKVKEDNSFFMKLTIKGLLSTFPNVKNVSTQTLHYWMYGRSDAEGDTSSVAEKPANYDDPGKVVILDARPSEEFDVSHIVGAIPVHPSAETADVEKIISTLKQDKDSGKQTVIAYCSLGYRGAKYADTLGKLLKKGHPELDKSVTVYNLEGGLFKWANENKPMVDVNSRPTVFAHPFNPVFGKLLCRNLRKQQPDP